MSEIKFSCPNCQQHLQAEAGYAGLQIDCPACNAAMIVPQPAFAAAPAPVEAAAPRPVSSPQRTALSTATAPPPRTAASGTCPSCGGVLARGAVLCTKCGYNLVTKQRTVAGRPAAPGKPAADQWEVPWYKTPYPYVGALVVAMGTLYFLGRQNPPFMMAFVGIGALYTLTAHIIVAVAAFKEGIGTGFLSLCIPIYALYFVFRVSDSDSLKILYGVAFVVNIVLRFIET
jgi:hypothetical protein